MPLEARVAHGLTESEAARLAREVYGLEASARALPGEYDENFHLIAAPGRAFVLKVMHPAREPRSSTCNRRRWCISPRARRNSPCRACCRIATASSSRKRLLRMARSGWFGC